MYEDLAVHGVAIPAGTCPTVGADGDLAARCLAMSLGTASDLLDAVNRLTPAPSEATFESRDWIDAMRRYAGTDQERQFYDTRSAFIGQNIGDDGIKSLIAAVEEAGAVATAAFTALGGAINRVDALATAFVHRRYRVLAQYEAYWSDHPTEAAAVMWLGRVVQTMRPHTSGAMYQNAPDPTRSDYLDAYYGPAAPRLVALKHRFDPHGIVHHPQGLTL